MKKLVLTLIVCSFFAATSVFGQQWNGAQNSTGAIDRNGNVGIQVSNPYARLDIKSVEGSTGGPVVLYPHLRLRTEFMQVEGFSNWDITGTGSLRFDYGTTTSNMSTVLAVSSSLLDYRGSNLRIGTGENQYNLGSATSPSNKSGHFLAFGASNTAGVSAWQFTGNSTNNGGAIIHSDDQGNLYFITRGTATSNLMNVTQTNDNIRMRIHGNGKISIGTGNTDTDINANGDDYLLFIKGGTLSEEVAVRTGWADYVFDENYTLLPLEQVETFITKNGHLPNTPSAADLNGTVKLGEATVNQQEKIEEIYLHLIEMNKEMKALKAENAEYSAQVTELLTEVERLKLEIEKLKN
jgi:hypothetical protein